MIACCKCKLPFTFTLSRSIKIKSLLALLFSLFSIDLEFWKFCLQKVQAGAVPEQHTVVQEWTRKKYLCSLWPWNRTLSSSHIFLNYMHYSATYKFKISHCESGLGLRRWHRHWQDTTPTRLIKSFSSMFSKKNYWFRKKKVYVYVATVVINNCYWVVKLQPT